MPFLTMLARFIKPQPRTLTARFRALVLAALSAAAAPAHAENKEPAHPQGSLGGCLAAVISGKAPEISCDYDALLTDEERGDMRRLSRGLLDDVSCRVRIKIARPLVEAALREADHAFEAPPQPVRCEVKTKEGGFPITATFAPKAVFKGGAAVEAPPGLGNVTGINAYLAWPIVQYVNRSPGIRKDMLEIINALRPKLAQALTK